MVLTDELDNNIFNNRDIEGNESDHGEYMDSDDNYSTDETESSSEDNDIGESPPTTSQEDIELRDKVVSVLGFLDIIGFKLVDFLDGLSWGNIACVQDTKVRSERTVLMRSNKLLGILKRWAFPPRSQGSKNRRAQGASTVMNTFATQYVQAAISRELEDLAPHVKSSATDSEDILKQTLVSTSFQDLASVMQPNAPILWEMLSVLTSRPKTRRHLKRETKDPTKVQSQP